MAKRVSKKKPNAAPAGPTLPKRSERILGLAVNTFGHVPQINARGLRSSPTRMAGDFGLRGNSYRIS
jgi:hypothetical protein